MSCLKQVEYFVLLWCSLTDNILNICLGAPKEMTACFTEWLLTTRWQRIATTYHQLVSSMSKKHLFYTRKTTFRNHDAMTRHCKLSYSSVSYLNTVLIELKQFPRLAKHQLNSVIFSLKGNGLLCLHTVFVLYLLIVRCETIAWSRQGKSRYFLWVQWTPLYADNRIRTECFLIIPNKKDTFERSFENLPKQNIMKMPEHFGPFDPMGYLKLLSEDYYFTATVL